MNNKKRTIKKRMENWSNPKKRTAAITSARNGVARVSMRALMCKRLTNYAERKTSERRLSIRVTSTLLSFAFYLHTHIIEHISPLPRCNAATIHSVATKVCSYGNNKLDAKSTKKQNKQNNDQKWTATSFRNLWEFIIITKSLSDLYPNSNEC